MLDEWYCLKTRFVSIIGNFRGSTFLSIFLLSFKSLFYKLFSQLIFLFEGRKNLWLSLVTVINNKSMINLNSNSILQFSWLESTQLYKPSWLRNRIHLPPYQYNVLECRAKRRHFKSQFSLQTYGPIEVTVNRFKSRNISRAVLSYCHRFTRSQFIIILHGNALNMSSKSPIRLTRLRQGFEWILIGISISNSQWPWLT